MRRIERPLSMSSRRGTTACSAEAALESKSAPAMAAAATSSERSGTAAATFSLTTKLSWQKQVQVQGVSPGQSHGESVGGTELPHGSDSPPEQPQEICF